jgi:hypothetical protein
MVDRIVTESDGGVKLGTNHRTFPFLMSLGRLAGKAITYHRVWEQVETETRNQKIDQ